MMSEDVLRQKKKTGKIKIIGQACCHSRSLAHMHMHAHKHIHTNTNTNTYTQFCASVLLHVCVGFTDLFC